jgi:hypothetical protein
MRTPSACFYLFTYPFIKHSYPKQLHFFYKTKQSLYYTMHFFYFISPIPTLQPKMKEENTGKRRRKQRRESRNLTKPARPAHVPHRPVEGLRIPSKHFPHLRCAYHPRKYRTLSRAASVSCARIDISSASHNIPSPIPANCTVRTGCDAEGRKRGSSRTREDEPDPTDPPRPPARLRDMRACFDEEESIESSAADRLREGPTRTNLSSSIGAPRPKDGDGADEEGRGDDVEAANGGAVTVGRLTTGRGRTRVVEGPGGGTAPATTGSSTSGKGSPPLQPCFVSAHRVHRVNLGRTSLGCRMGQKQSLSPHRSHL